MVAWLRQAGIEGNTLVVMQREWYGDQVDEEEQGLREVR
jgi:hypothetical protein